MQCHSISTSQLNNRIGVVIVTYNSQEWIGPCVKSILTSETSVDEILIVDNASREPISPAVIEEDPCVVCLKLSRNVGYGRANNIGIHYLLRRGCDYIVLMNPDARLRENTLSELAYVLMQDHNLGVATGLQLNYEDGELNVMSKRYCYKAIGDYSQNAYIYSSLGEGERPDGSLLMITREAFLKAGGFDPIFFLYFEDIDLLRRMVFCGIRIAISKTAFYHHYISHSYRKSNVSPAIAAEQIYYFYRSNYIHALANPTTNYFVNHLRFAIEFARGFLRYIPRRFVFRKFLAAFLEIPWVQCYLKWKRDIRRDYRLYLEAIVSPADIGLVSNVFSHRQVTISQNISADVAVKNSLQQSLLQNGWL